MSDTTNLSVVSPTYEDGLLYIDIPFEWIDEDDLHVAELGEADALPRPATNQDATTWRFINRQKIQIINPVVGKAYRVERRTSTDNVYAEFVPGTPIRSQDLNSNFKQTLHVVQENTGDRWSRTGDTMQGNIAMATYDANGNIVQGQGPFRVTGLDDPINDRDAVNKQSLAAYATTFTDLGTTAQETLEKYLGPVTTLPEYKVNEVNAGDVPELGTLAFYQNKMWMLVATGNAAYHAVWNEVVVAQVNPLNTFRTTIYPQGSSEVIRLNNLDTATDTTMGVVTYTLNSDHFANQSLSISTANFNILQINGKTLKPFTNSQGDYRASPATQGNEIYIAKDILDNEPFGNDKNLEVTLISFSSVDVAPSGWSSAEWTYNDQTSKWELTLIGDSSDLDITVDNLMPSFSAGTVTEVVNNSDNSVGTPTFNVRKKDPNDPNSNEYEIDAGIPTGKSGGTINQIEFDNSGVPTYTFTNGSSLVGNVSLKGNKGDTGDYIGSSTFAYKAAPGSPGGFNHNLGAIDGMDGAGTLPSNYLEIIENWNVSNSSNQVGFADVYQLVGRYRLFSVGTAEETGQFFDVTNPEYLIGPAPYLSMGSVTTAAAGQGGSATFTDDLLTGDGYKLNLVLEAPRISVDGHTVTSFAEGTEGETESATFQYDGSSRLHTMQLNIEKAGPPTFATGSVNVTDNVNSDASVTFNDAGGDLSSDYVINVDLPLPLIEVGSGTETYNENTYVDGIRVVGSLSDPNAGQFAVYLDQQSKSDVDSNITGDDADDPTSKFKMYMDVPVFPAPQIEINTTVEEGDAPSVERGYLDDGTWTAGVNSADSTEYNLKFTLPAKVKSGNGHPDGQTAQKDKWNVVIDPGVNNMFAHPYGVNIAIDGLGGWAPVSTAAATDILQNGSYVTLLNELVTWFMDTAQKDTLYQGKYSSVTVNTTSRTLTFTSTADEPFTSFTASVYYPAYITVKQPTRTQTGGEATTAVSGVQDQIYYDFHNNKVYQHNGSNWVEQSGFGESIESLHWDGGDGKLYVSHQDTARSITTGDLRGPGYTDASYDHTTGKITFTANGFQGTTDFTTDDLRIPWNPQGGVTELPSNLANTTDDIGKFYLLTQDQGDNLLGHGYYWTGTEYNDFGYMRGLQGVSVSSVDLDIATAGKAILNVEMSDGTKPIEDVDIMPPRFDVSSGSITSWQTDTNTCGGQLVFGSNWTDDWRDGDRTLYLGNVTKSTGPILFGPGHVVQRQDSNLVVLGTLRGADGNAKYDNDINVEGSGAGLKPTNGQPQAYYLVKGSTYRFIHDDPNANFQLYGVTLTESTIDTNMQLVYEIPTDKAEDWVVLGPTSAENDNDAYNKATANIGTTPVGDDGFHLIKLYDDSHTALSKVDTTRYIESGDVTVTEDANTGRITFGNTNKVTVVDPVNGDLTGTHTITTDVTGNFANFKSTDGANAKVELPPLNTDDVGVTTIINNTGDQKLTLTKGAGVQLVLAGSAVIPDTIEVNVRGMAYVTYLHDAYEANGKAWAVTGQGLQGFVG